MTRVALDAMGGEDAPAVEIDGAVLALQELPDDVSIAFVGKPEIIEPHLARHPELDRSRIEIVAAREVVSMTDKPLQAIRQKRDSSLVVGLTMHRDGKADAFVSAGNTGATLAGATLLLGLHDGVERATVASHFPALPNPVLVLDAGANLECSARELVNFAHLGSVYMHDLLKRERPTVGLLNVGEEDEKGSKVVREAHALLQADEQLNYIGNIEGRDIVVPHPKHGPIDVVVCDGFVGNVVLKFYESMAILVEQVVKRDIPDLVDSDAFKPLIKFLDYGEYGGAPLLGTRGVPIVCHGSTTPFAIKNAIRMAVESVRSGLNTHIAEDFAGRGR